MSQYDFGIIDPNTTSGSELAVLLQNFRDALNTGHSGTTAPAYAQPGTLWLDTSGGATAYIIKIYDGSQWIPALRINTTANTSTPYIDGTTVAGGAAGYAIGNTGTTIPLNSYLGSLSYLSSVAEAQLANLAVTAAKLADNAVTTSKLNTSAVTNSKVADSTLTISKLAPSTPNKFVGFDGSGTPALFDPPVSGIICVQRSYTASGTWTKYDDLLYIEVEVIGGGGGGGGGPITGSTDNGGGGGGGSYARKIVSAAALGATETVTIGGGGAGAATGTGAQLGGTGGTTSFGSHVSAPGGAGGRRNPPTGGAGGSASTGDFNLTGGYGLNDTKGGGSHYGYGGRGDSSLAYGYGGGGSGGYLSSAGSSGTAGVVIVKEYYRSA